MRTHDKRGRQRARPAGRARRAAFALGCLVAGPALAAGDLIALSLEQLMEVKIVGASKYEQDQRAVAAAASVITRQEIKAHGWRTLAEALASLPGVYVTHDRQYTYLGTRGFGLPGDLTTRMLITVDGNRVNDPTYDGGPMGRELPIDLDLVERIEFLPGPGGAVYGQNAMLGVVNLVTRSGQSVDGGRLAFGYQTPQRAREGRATAGRRFDGGLDLLVSASGLRARGDDLDIDFGASGTAGVAAGLDGERDREFFGRGALGPWAVQLVHGNRRKDDPTGSFLSDPLVPGQYIRDRYSLAQLQYQDRFARDTLHLSARVFSGSYRFDSRLVYGTPYEYPASASWRGGELRLLSTAIAGHKLMVGLEGQDNVRTDQAVIDTASGAAVFRGTKSGYRIGLYAQDEWQVAPALATTLGLRVDRNDVTGTETSPRAGLIWRVTDRTAVKALYGRAHRAPNVYESDFEDGVSLVRNPALRGERIDTLELVLDRRIDATTTMRGSVYQWDMRNLVTLGIDPASGLPQYQSGQPMRARGVEMSLDRTSPGGARLRGSVSLQAAEYESGATLVNSPRLLAKVGGQVPLPLGGLRLAYETRFEGRRRAVDGSEVGSFALANVNLVAVGIAPGVDLSVGVFNVFDRRYAHPIAEGNWQVVLPQDGRIVRLTLALAF